MPQESWRDAKPVKPRRDAGAPADLVDVEKRLLACDDLLAELEGEIKPTMKAAANAERLWLSHRDPIILTAFHSDKRTGEDVRDAMARQKDTKDGKTGEELWVAYRDAETDAKSVHKRMEAVMSRQSALQTLARTIRNASGLG